MASDRFVVTCLAATLALAVGPAAARERQPVETRLVEPRLVEPWPVDGKLLGKPKGDGSESRKSTDVSGIACAETGGFPRVCVIADDEAQGVQIVRVEDGRIVAGDAVRLIRDVHDGKLLELDAEGVAYAEGFFYVVGSHGRPRHETDRATGDARAAATRHLFRLRFDPAAVKADGALTGAVDIRDSRVLARLLKAQAETAPAFDARLDGDGLTIEGVAVRGDRLSVGLRSPLLEDGRAAVLSMPLDVLFADAAGTAQLHRLDLGRDSRGKARGVRDLVAYGDGFLVIAGPVLDPETDVVSDADYTVYAWDGRDGTRSLGDLNSYGTKVKPEALLPLSVEAGRLRALMLFDGPDEGAPRTVELETP